MGEFIGSIDLQALDDGEHWQTLEIISYRDDLGELISVPIGFVTDLASVPRIFWTLVPPFGKYDGAAIIHDYLYTTQQYTRSKCDEILLEAMKTDGVGWLTRWTIYLAVRSFGWIPWGDRAKQLNHE